MNANIRLQNIMQELQQASYPVTLVAVSKTHAVKDIQTLYDLGLRDFGESRLSEALSKMEQLPKDIRWHWLGRLQTKKIKKVIENFYLIHSVDSLACAQKISEQAQHPIRILLQANTSGETTKAGLSSEAWEACFPALLELPYLSLEGCMTMAPHTPDVTSIRACFRSLKTLQERLQKLALDRTNLPILSMGMSEDYRIALQEGATMVRIGRALFTSTH